MRKGGPVIHDRRIPAKKTLTTGGNTPPVRVPTRTMTTGGNTPPTRVQGKILRTGGPGQVVSTKRKLPPISTPTPPTRKAPKKRRTY